MTRCWLLLAALVVTASASAQPNVVLVFIDDMGWADPSCFGNETASTPHIDRLAAEGIRFEQFYVNSPICSPSRVAISTGQYPQRWKITSFLNNRQNNIDRGMAQWLDLSAPMLSRFLHDAGYATGHFGKWHMGGQRDVPEAPLIAEYGFDESLTNFEGLGPRVLGLKYPTKGNPPRHNLGSHMLGRGPVITTDRAFVTQMYVRSAVDFINWAQANEKPFYVNLWPDDVHGPYHPPKQRRGDGSRRAMFNGCLEAMDVQLSGLFDRIRNDEKLRDNTLVLFCSDNGPDRDAGQPGPFRGLKATLYEAGVRSPLIAWAPGLQQKDVAGTVNRESIFSAIDLVPSTLAITGAEAPAKVAFDGESLEGVLLGASKESRTKPIFFRRPPDREEAYGLTSLPDLAMRSGEWKFLCEYDGSNPQLYDMQSDLGEATNVAGEHPEVVEQLREQLLAWHESMPADNGATYSVRPKKQR